MYIFISGINNQNLTPQTYHKSTYIGLLNFKSFTSFSYKISLIKCLIDGSLKICNNWNSLHNHIESIKSNLINLLKLAVVLAILLKLALILKLGLRNISNRITGHTLLNIYTPPHHALLI